MKLNLSLYCHPYQPLPLTPHLSTSIHVTWLRSHFIITLTAIMVIMNVGKLPLLCVSKHHITFAIFATETIILGVLQVGTRNS
jgi:hypothetical protein